MDALSRIWPYVACLGTCLFCGCVHYRADVCTFGYTFKRKGSVVGIANVIWRNQCRPSNKPDKMYGQRGAAAVRVSLQLYTLKYWHWSGVCSVTITTSHVLLQDWTGGGMSTRGSWRNHEPEAFWWPAMPQYCNTCSEGNPRTPSNRNLTGWRPLAHYIHIDWSVLVPVEPDRDASWDTTGPPCFRLVTTPWCCWFNWACWPMTFSLTPSVNSSVERLSISWCCSRESPRLLNELVRVQINELTN